MTRVRPVVGEMMRLRPVEASDAPALWVGAQDPEVVRQVGARLPGSYAETEVWAREVADTPGRLDLAVTALEDDTMIGEIVLDEQDDEARRARLHMWMLPGHRGRGYGREAIFRLLEIAFDPEPAGIGLHRVSLLVPTLNPRARSLYESFGFRDEGVLREHFRDGDGFVDATAMGLLAEEFDRDHGMFTPQRALVPGGASRA